MLDNYKPLFGHAKAHEMSIGAAHELEEVEDVALFTSPQAEALMDAMGDGDEEAWERLQKLAADLKAKQHRRNSI